MISHILTMTLQPSLICLAILTLLTPSVQSLDFLILEDVLRNNKEAEETCRNLGYDGLAVLDNSQDFSQARSHVNTSLGEMSQHWIGLRYCDSSSSFVWDSGIPLSWTKWHPVEPDHLPRDKCVRIRTSGEMGTYGCNTGYYTICGNYTKFAVDVDFRWPDTGTADMSSVLWEGTVRSQMDCVRQCAANRQCHYIAFHLHLARCTILSADFDVTGAQSIPGSQLGEKMHPC